VGVVDAGIAPARQLHYPRPHVVWDGPGRSSATIPVDDPAWPLSPVGENQPPCLPLADAQERGRRSRRQPACEDPVQDLDPSFISCVQP
jgi:hypothetical protein